MFGKDAPPYEQVSEDEDWGPSKRKRREKESDAASTLMTLYESEKKRLDPDTREGKKKRPLETPTRRPFFRIPYNAVEVVEVIPFISHTKLPIRASSFFKSLEPSSDIYYADCVLLLVLYCIRSFVKFLLRMNFLLKLSRMIFQRSWALILRR